MEDFDKYKLICVDLLKSPSIVGLENLQTLIENTKSDSIHELQEYILFPLYIILSNKQTRNEKIIFGACNCVKSVCKRSTVKIFKIFSDYFLQLLLFIDDASPVAESIGAQSEEVKLIAMETLLAFLKSASNGVIHQLLSDACKPMFGHFIFSTLKIAANEDHKELRLTALDCLYEAISYPHESLSKTLTGFFPGICTNMVKIIDGNIKQSHVVTQKAVSLFSAAIQLVLSNQRVKLFQGPEVEWLKQTKRNLHVILGKICKIADLHWKVKLELVTFLATLVEVCSDALEMSLPLLIRKLVQLTVDECQDVQSKAKTAANHLSIAEARFDSAIRQNLYDIVTALPRIMTQGIAREQHLILEELHGHLELLGPRLDQSLIFSGLRERLFKSLLIASSIESAKVIEGDEPYNLIYLRDLSVTKSFAACCFSIGKNSNLADTTDFLLDILRQKDSYSCESAYMMLLVIQGATVDISTLSNVAQEYGNALSSLDGDSLSNVILGHLLLRVIGEVAKQMKSSFSELLLKILRPVLEKAGHPDFHTAGLYALESISQAVQLRSVSHLLERNADYFAPQLTYQLRNIIRYPKAIDLLRALLLLSNVRLENWLERMVQQALKGLDRTHLHKALPYVQVFELYSKAIHKSKTNEVCASKPLCKNDVWSPDEVIRRIAEYETNLKTCKSLLEEDNEETSDVLPSDTEHEMMDLEPESEKDPPVPCCISLIADITDRCIQLLPQSQDERLYASIIQTIRFSMEVLSSYENMFLPKVHQLWEPLKNQLHSTSHLKQRQAFEIFIYLIQSCPDFVRHRSLTEALPKILTFLENQANVSRKRFSKAHLASQAYKFQKILLSSMALLVQYLDPSIADVIEVVHITSLYLSDQQPPELQCLAKENMIQIVKYHPGAVWLSLNSLVQQRVLTLETFPSLTVGRDDIDNEYRLNAEKLVCQLFPLSR